MEGGERIADSRHEGFTYAHGKVPAYRVPGVPARFSLIARDFLLLLLTLLIIFRLNSFFRTRAKRNAPSFQFQVPVCRHFRSFNLPSNVRPKFLFVLGPKYLLWNSMQLEIVLSTFSEILFSPRCRQSLAGGGEGEEKKKYGKGD